MQDSLKGFEYVFRMPVHLDVPENLLDDARLIDDVGGAEDAVEFFTEHRLLTVGPVSRGDHAVGVRQQGEVQLQLLGELLVADFVIGTDADDGRVFPLYLLQLFIEVPRLRRASRRVVLRVEVEHDLLALVFREPMHLAVRVPQSEGGGFCSFSQCRHFAPCCCSSGDQKKPRVPSRMYGNTQGVINLQLSILT